MAGVIVNSYPFYMLRRFFIDLTKQVYQAVPLYSVGTLKYNQMFPTVYNSDLLIHLNIYAVIKACTTLFLLLATLEAIYGGRRGQLDHCGTKL